MKHNKNGLLHFLTVLVAIIVYLVIHLYCNGMRNDLLNEHQGYENNNSKQPVNNIRSTIKKDNPIDDDHGKTKPKPLEIVSIGFAQANVSVRIGDTIGLILQVNPSSLISSKFTWSSSDPSIVSIDSNGFITGLKEGTATITVTSPNGKTATVKVTVVTNEVKVDKIILNPSSLSLNVGDSKQVSAIIEPENATNRELVWTSSNPSVATVDNNGVVKGVSPGTTTITVKTKDGTVVSEIIVTILAPTPTPLVIESLKFPQDNISIKKGDELGLVVEVIPSELASSKLTWTSSDPSIVSVDENGVIKGLKEGTATITVTSPNGKTAIVKVTVVTDEVKVDKIILTPSSLSLNVGDSKQVSAKIEPENATNRELVWTSSNPSVATVDDKGVIKGVNPGTTTIIVKTKDGTVVEEITVTVLAPTPTPVVTPTPTPTPVVTPTPTPTPTEKIVFEYDYDKSNYIYLVNQFPIKDEVGKNLQGDKRTQDFKLKFNEKAAGVKYTITLEKLDDSDFDDEWIKLYLVNDGTDVANCYRGTGRIKTFNEYVKYKGNSKEVVLYEGVVSSAEATRGYKDFTFRMWVSEDLKLVNSDYLSETKTYKARINVYASE